MISHSFQLHPFKTFSAQVSLSVTGTLLRQDNVLHLHFRLAGETASVLLPEKLAEPLRCDNLWRTTCFECFLRAHGSMSYHELNLSPSGCWNLYHFSDYRTAMQIERAITDISSEIRFEEACCLVHCVFSLDKIVRPGDVLEIGVSCVLEHKQGEKSYWALSHPGQQPDFHHPEGFGLEV